MELNLYISPFKFNYFSEFYNNCQNVTSMYYENSFSIFDGGPTFESVNPVLYQSQMQSFPEIYNDYLNIGSMFYTNPFSACEILNGLGTAKPFIYQPQVNIFAKVCDCKKVEQKPENTSPTISKNPPEIKSVNPIMYRHQAEKLPEVYDDIKEIKSIIDKTSSIAFKGTPVVGKLADVPEQIKKGDYVPAIGNLLLAILDSPSAWNELVSACKQIKTNFAQKPITFHDGYDNKYAQHPFSFFRGTLLHKYLNPNSKYCRFRKLAAWLVSKDKCLWDTKVGEWFKNAFNVRVKGVETNIEEIISTTDNKRFVPAKKFLTKNIFKNFTARAMTRIPVIGVLVSAVLEAGHIAHEVSNGKDLSKEITKSAIRLTVSICLSAILGAIGAAICGLSGSLIGIGIATVIANAIDDAMEEAF